MKFAVRVISGAERDCSTKYLISRQVLWSDLKTTLFDAPLESSFMFTADVRQPWTNYVNNGNEYLIIGAVVHFEYSYI